MKFEVKIDNIKNYTKHLIKCRNEIDDIFKKHTQLGAMKLYEYLTNNTPVDTGNLKANWNIAQNVLRDDNIYSIFIDNPTYYGIYVDFGHRLRNGEWWEGYHFVRRSEEDFEEFEKYALLENIKLELKKIIDKGGN